jgi:Tfp pilus assembly protein PilW
MRRKRGKNRAGFTVVELMVGLSAALIVFFATAIMMVFGQRSLNRGWEQANLQRDASYAMLKVKQAIRGGVMAQLDGDGNGVKIYHAAGWIRFWYVPAHKDLRYQFEGEEERTLLDGVVSSATFAIDPVTSKTVTVGFELQSGGSETQMSSTTLMRNCP